ncbi:MAG: twin-arginine translocase subunit TatC [Candidatus Omnitrophota bacterium]
MTARPNRISFLNHLEELKSRIIKCVISVVAASFVFYGFVDEVFLYLVQPVGYLVFNSPAEAFVAHVSLAVWGGFLLALPVVLYQIWRFVAVGLTNKEQKYILIFFPASLVFFFCGALFAHVVMIPLSLRFLLSFSSGRIVPMITVSQYIAFVGSFILAFGLVFELPLFFFFLAKMGMVNSPALSRKRRHAVVVILFVSALLTPPDIFSQILMAVPLMVLYEIGIIVVRFASREAKDGRGSA